MDWTTLLQREFFGNSVRDWGLSVALVVVVTVVLKTVATLVLKRLGAIAERTANDVDDLAVELLAKTKTLAILLMAVWVAARPLVLSARADQIVRAVLVIGVLLQLGYWGMGVINYVVNGWKGRQLEEDPGMATAVGAMGFIGKLALWTLLLLSALGNMGVDVTTFVASLGIGGIAIALALQNVLGDLLASISIVLDKPFVIGDFIVVGDLQGSVENVGLKTTRIRSLSGEQLVFANSDLLSSRIRNYGRMEERRVAFTIGVTYDTAQEQLARVPGLMEQAVEAHEQARFDRCHLKSLGDFSLNFETVYYMSVPDYAAYMDVQQAVNLQLIERFAGEGIEFAFPTQTLHVMKPDPD